MRRPASPSHLSGRSFAAGRTPRSPSRATSLLPARPTSPSRSPSPPTRHWVPRRPAGPGMPVLVSMTARDRRPDPSPSNPSSRRHNPTTDRRRGRRTRRRAPTSRCHPTARGIPAPPASHRIRTPVPIRPGRRRTRRIPIGPPAGRPHGGAVGPRASRTEDAADGESRDGSTWLAPEGGVAAASHPTRFGLHVLARGFYPEDPGLSSQFAGRSPPPGGVRRPTEGASWCPPRPGRSTLLRVPA
jgi:hypothetical protein